MSATPDEVKQRVVEYYLATTEQSYLANWSGDSLGFHFGLADDRTQSLAESIRNTNAYLADRAGIHAGSRVLDAGCGVGGSAIWLAREKGARVTGITLVERQVELARRFAGEREVEELVSFEMRDMCSTGFAEASFDVVWNIESMCHAVDLAAYLAHVAHLLVDGGRFACIDLCTGAIADPAIERTICDGWAMVLRRPADIAAALERLGFEAIEVVDLTPRALMCAQALEAMAGRSLLKIRAEEAFLGETAPPLYEGHVRAALAMAAGLRTGRSSLSHFLAKRRPRVPRR